MIRAANGRRLKKLVEELFSKSNNTFFSSQIENKEHFENNENKENKKNKINYNGLEENITEGYNDRED